MTILDDRIRIEKEADRLEMTVKSNEMKGNSNQFKMR